MVHRNISVFIPHAGCPNMCSFCNQNKISGAEKPPSPDEVYRICKKQFDNMSDRSNTEIAFFGGSFTAIPHEYMTALLECVQPFICDDGFDGIRISTRPDCINNEILEILRKYNVKSIELGCQSLDDKVLELNNRGHDSECVYNSCKLIRKYGFELGLQMMTGLYGSDYRKDIETAEKICSIKPDTARIYPVVILKNTKLDELYQSGIYKIYSYEYMTDLCSEIMKMFRNCGVRVIKCGLHASESVEKNMTGGYYHPSFRELCESRIFRNTVENVLKNYRGKNFAVNVAERNISRAVGHNHSNIKYFSEKGYGISFIADKNISEDEFILFDIQEGGRNVFKIT